MKQQEKTQKTRERILHAALAEFGSKSYDAASVNSICEAGQIPKGLLYHNFKGKDDLYLNCVKICYDAMTDSLKSQALAFQDAKEGMQQILMARQKFLAENPCYANIFFNTVIQPPRRLVRELAQMRKGLDDYFSQCCLDVLDCLTLRDGITKEAALEYFLMTSEMFNGYFQKKAEQGGDFRELIQDHEGRLSSIFDIMLYGIAKEPPGGRRT